MQFNFEIDIKNLVGHQMQASLHDKKTFSILCIGAYTPGAVSNNQPSDYWFEGYYMLPIDQFERQNVQNFRFYSSYYCYSSGMDNILTWASFIFVKTLLMVKMPKNFDLYLKRAARHVL